MADPKLIRIEQCLVKGWKRLESGMATNNLESVEEAKSSLASSMAYLLNIFLDSASSVNWRGYGADDLLDAEYVLEFRQMTATGLMCWGDLDQVFYLSPFVGRFELDAEEASVKDFTLFFAAAGPDDDSELQAFTRNLSSRRRILESRPRNDDEWANVFRREDFLDS